MALHVFCKSGQNVQLKEALFKKFDKNGDPYVMRDWEMDSDGKMNLLFSGYYGKAHFKVRTINGTGILTFAFVETVDIIEKDLDLYSFFHKKLQEMLHRDFRQYFYLMQNIPTDLPSRPVLDERFPHPVKPKRRPASYW